MVGKVYLAREKKTKMVVAIKAIEMKTVVRTGTVDLIQNEVDIQMHMRQESSSRGFIESVIIFRHKNILGLYGYFWDDHCLYLIQEYGCYGDLHKILKMDGPFSERKAAWFVRQIAEGIQHMHANHVIHRDIKTENVLVGEGVGSENGIEIILQFLPKICDFGWSVHVSNEIRNTVCGTPAYIPPEIARGEGYDQSVGLRWNGEVVGGCLEFGNPRL